MLALGIAVAAVAAFIASSVYYVAATPLEQRIVGSGAVKRGAPTPVKVVAELLRTAVVAGVMAWLAEQAHLATLPETLLLALVAWVGFPAVLLTGSILWERIHPFTAAMHAGDWLIKLVLVGTVLGLLH